MFPLCLGCFPEAVPTLSPSAGLHCHSYPLTHRSLLPTTRENSTGSKIIVSQLICVLMLEQKIRLNKQALFSPRLSSDLKFSIPITMTYQNFFPQMKETGWSACVWYQPKQVIQVYCSFKPPNWNMSFNGCQIYQRERKVLYNFFNLYLTIKNEEENKYHS